MAMQEHTMELAVVVDCPATGRPEQVRLFRDETGNPQIDGCSRWDGFLFCRGTCRDQAIEAWGRIVQHRDTN